MTTTIYTGHNAITVIDHLHCEALADGIDYWFPEVSFARGIPIPVHPAELITYLTSTRFFGQNICTLSEHFILHFQKQVRDGAMKPEDIKIYYIDLVGDEPQQITIDDQGDIENWPGGFFPERLQLLR